MRLIPVFASQHLCFKSGDGSMMLVFPSKLVVTLLFNCNITIIFGMGISLLGTSF